MFGKSKEKPDLMVAFGVGGKKKDEDPDESGVHESEGAGLNKACEEFFTACGITPKDPEKARDALKSFIEIVHAEGE